MSEDDGYDSYGNECCCISTVNGWTTRNGRRKFPRTFWDRNRTENPSGLSIVDSRSGFDLPVRHETD